MKSFDGQFGEGEVGYSVKYNDVEKIVEIIVDTVNDYERISSNCTNKVDRFDLNRIYEEYIKTYNSTLFRI